MRALQVSSASIAQPANAPASGSKASADARNAVWSSIFDSIAGEDVAGLQRKTPALSGPATQGKGAADEVPNLVAPVQPASTYPQEPLLRIADVITGSATAAITDSENVASPDASGASADSIGLERAAGNPLNLLPGMSFAPVPVVSAPEQDAAAELDLDPPSGKGDDPVSWEISEKSIYAVDASTITIPDAPSVSGPTAQSFTDAQLAAIAQRTASAADPMQSNVNAAASVASDVNTIGKVAQQMKTGAGESITAGRKQAATPTAKGDERHRHAEEGDFQGSSAVSSLSLPSLVSPTSEAVQRSDKQHSESFAAAHTSGTSAAISEPKSTNAVAPAGDLSFAIRVSPSEDGNLPSQSNEQGDAQQAHAAAAIQQKSAESVQSGWQPVSQGATVRSGTEHASNSQRQAEPNPGMLASVASMERPAEASSSVAPASNGQVTPRSAEIEVHPETPANEPVRDVRLHVSGENNERVDVRLVDRGGELRVSVRSTDNNLSQTLQEHVPELTSRLEQQHLRSEVWIPRGNSPEPTAAHANQSNSGSGTPDGSNAGQQQRRRQPQPEWVDEFENVPKGNQTQRTNFTWPQ